MQGFARLSSLSLGTRESGPPPVKISPSFRIDPPIPLSDALQGLSVLPSPTGPTANSKGFQGNAELLAFKMENQLLDKGPVNFAEKALSEGQAKDWQDPLINQFLEMGISRQQAALGLAYVESAQANQSEVLEFATNVDKLQQMGFSLSVAAGSLSEKKNNLGAAMELCLALK
uniref:UBA domain-containing protein n=1 Tax=Dunaliella tertiolecta TaxID=3047 RepID=A0A7S3VQY2_DUNTE|mmetsp:Transcript_13087/g.35638  ORF Transcript_13087/g.35638 Transcript_13087/m.35638 type:complete len:173 (-) Transcript_13087:242-760(-)